MTHTVGSVVHFVMPGGTSSDTACGTVLAIPVARRQLFYVVQLNDGTTINLDPTEIISTASALEGLTISMRLKVTPFKIH